MSTKQNVFTQEQIMQLLDKMYEQCLHGIPKVSPPISELANNYLEKNDNVYSAASSFINYQIAKCTTSGFVTGLGGLITLPVTIPANISSVMYVQMRMIACIELIWAAMILTVTKYKRLSTLVWLELLWIKF